MKKIILILVFAILSCKSNNIKNTEKTENANILDLDTISKIDLDANHLNNNEVQLIYNSIDTISTTLIINKEIISKKEMKAVLDTIRMQNYIVKIDKKGRKIILTSK
ncbi:hypothetical protein ESY86_19930 [Subsaximicrobium wynnwilliamsii]|uniref:Uncharacterized protein n=1 Tax=Subsaximicrobium wynnwilliamsii TaxID=291179 RepID=A0A5C6Z9S3_9FLAO|nr:hypothetical protein [Subsaximicrobium wynnwilliamsii]TXD80808.1 hypothetical protein ESY87_20100 [Subsaximicrobium wynnwilliamsii]TXD86550.1 hypothetical protein ESY86_19930 [Subsaximicrobium wynnwilliamsii]TXE00096.1 hypothetical protein ESY88_20040 [Subsaximicrobium wynnwilliamsii]